MFKGEVMKASTAVGCGLATYPLFFVAFDPVRMVALSLGVFAAWWVVVSAGTPLLRAFGTWLRRR